jgi:hypothetical protein
VWIGGDRIEQLDLEADERLDPGFIGGDGEAHRAIEALVIGESEGGHAQADRLGDQVLGWRGPVEEREVRMTVQLDEGHTIG